MVVFSIRILYHYALATMHSAHAEEEEEEGNAEHDLDFLFH